MLLDKDTFKGKAVVDKKNIYLYLKNYKYQIINEKRKKNIGFNTLSNDPWLDEYTTCNCNKN